MAIMVPQQKQKSDRGLGQLMQIGGAVAGGIMGGPGGALAGANVGGSLSNMMASNQQAPSQAMPLPQQQTQVPNIASNPNTMQLQQSIQALSSQPQDLIQAYEQPLIAAFNQSLAQGRTA